MPMVGGLVGVLVSLGIMALVLRVVTPQVRALPVPARLAIVLAFVAVPFGIGYLALRRSGLGIRETGLLGSVLLIENLPVPAAVARTAELMKESGSLRNAVQKRYVAIVMIVSLLTGVALGAGGAIGRSAGVFVMLTPLLALAGVAFLTIHSVINAMMYISARRSKGESLERIYSDVTKDVGSISSEQGVIP